MLDLLAVQSSTTNATIITLAYTLCLAFILSSAIGWTYEKTFLGLSYSRNFVQGIRAFLFPQLRPGHRLERGCRCNDHAGHRR